MYSCQTKLCFRVRFFFFSFLPFYSISKEEARESCKVVRVYGEVYKYREQS